MALIIKGDMPTGKGCDGCEFQTSRCEQMDACTCYLFGGVIHNFHNERHENCPIIGEIPDKHGRLIDADKLIHAFDNRTDLPTGYDIYTAIAEAETIVEATE